MFLLMLCSSFGTLYVAAWIVMIAAGYDDYEKHGDAEMFVFFTLFGPLVLLMGVPVFVKTFATALKKVLTDWKDKRG